LYTLRGVPCGNAWLTRDEPRLVRRHVPLGPGAKRALIVLAAMVVVLATGALPPAVAGLLAAGAIVLRVLTIEDAYRGISWTTVDLVAGMIPLSTAMTETGAAADLADVLVDVVGDISPYALLAGLFILTAAPSAS
jgi:di/tricarboxylate transporter